MSLIDELKRRNVFRVGAAYLALGWVVTQVTDAVVSALHLPDALNAMVVWLGMAVFPFVLAFAWIYELTPEGLKRESEIDRTRSITQDTGRKLEWLIIGMLAVAIGLFLFDRFVPREALSPAAGAALARDDGADAGNAAADRAHGALPRQEKALPAPSTPDDKSIAVLPFVNMSSDKEQEYFADGISEELLNSLAKIPELKVIARTSSFAFKDKGAEISEIAQKLNVAHVLEGSVRKAGNTVRITAQLIRTADSTHLWSETYDRSLDDIFAVQDEIARNVVGQLKLKLLGNAPAQTVQNPEAYALTLQARALLNLRTPAANTRALELYRQALGLDGDNLAALVGIARTFFSMGAFDQIPVEDSERQARANVERAIAHDPDYVPAHVLLGFMALNTESGLGLAAEHYSRALELAPTDADALVGSVDLLNALGRLDIAIRIGEYSVARDPVNANGHRLLCQSYLLAARNEEAIRTCRTALALSPGLGNTSYFMGLAQLGSGDAVAALESFAAEADVEYGTKGTALAQYALGRHEEFGKSFATLRERWGAQWPSEIAQVYAWTGDRDNTFAWLDRALAQNEPGMNLQYQSPMYAPIRDDPRWTAFRERTGTGEAQLAAIRFDVTLPE